MDKYNLIESEGQVYEIRKAKINTNGNTMCIDLILNHVKEGSMAVGELIIVTEAKQGFLKRDTKETKVKRRIMTNVTTHLINNSTLTEQGYLTFTPNNDSILINELCKDIDYQVMIYETKRQKELRSNNYIKEHLKEHYKNITNLRINKLNNTINITTTCAEDTEDKTLISFIIKEHNLNRSTVKVRYHVKDTEVMESEVQHVKV